MEQKLSFEEQLARANETNPYMRHNRIRAVELTAEYSRVTAEMAPELKNAMGGVHGGLMFVMAEIAAGFLVRSDGRRYVTLDSSFRFLSGGSGEASLCGEARLTKRGRTVCFAKASVKEPGSGRVLAEGDFTFYCLDA